MTKTTKENRHETYICFDCKHISNHFYGIDEIKHCTPCGSKNIKVIKWYSQSDFDQLRKELVDYIINFEKGRTDMGLGFKLLLEQLKNKFSQSNPIQKEDKPLSMLSSGESIATDNEQDNKLSGTRRISLGNDKLSNPEVRASSTTGRDTFIDLCKCKGKCNCNKPKFS